MTPPARTRRTRAKDDEAIRPADEPILAALLSHHLLTAPQVGRLLYSPGALKHAYARLKRLADGGHVQALDMLRPGRTGAGPLVYVLARSGLDHLRELDVAIPDEFRLVEAKKHSYIFFDHALAVADAMIAAVLLCRARTDIDLEATVHERELKHHPVPVVLPNGKEARLVPDGWLRFLVEMADGRWRVPVCLEIDRGTTERKDWQDKVRAYLAAVDGSLLAAFDVKSVTVAIVAPGDGARRDELRRWTEAVLAEQHREHQGHLFPISGLDAAAVTPAAFYLSPSWVVPFGLRPVPLLEPKGGEGGG